MKCRSCDVILSDEEATRKYEGTTDYIDLCDACMEEVKDDFIYNYLDYKQEIVLDDEDDFEESDDNGNI